MHEKQIEKQASSRRVEQGFLSYSPAENRAICGTTANHALETHQLINQSSGKVEYFSPLEIVGSARRSMGGLDLDPASSALANRRIKAPHIFTKENDGLSQVWFGKVWLNHPFERGRNHLWINKLLSEFDSKNIEAACCITFASTSEAWFRPLLRFPQCWLYGRTNYFTPDGAIKRGATKGSAVTYLGRETQRFYDAFKELGEIKICFDSLDTPRAQHKFAQNIT